MPSEDRLNGNLWRWQAFQALIHTPLFLPVAVLFWAENGMDLFEVFLLQGLYAVAVVFLEVPTGMIADRMGKRTSVLLASVTYVGAMLFYAAGTGFWWFLAAEIGLAIGGALYSGADSALLFDTLEALDRREDYTRFAGRGRGIQMASIAVSTVLGGVVAVESLRATVALSAIGPCLACAVAWGFVEVRRVDVPASMSEGLTQYRDLLRGALRFVSRHQLVRWYLMLLAVLSGSASWLLWLYQPYMAHTGLPVWAFGAAFAIYNVFAATTSAFAHRFEDLLGPRGSLVALGILQVVPLPLMATLLGPASFLFVLGHQAVRALSRPILSQRVLTHTWDDKRATVLSLGAMGTRLFFAATAPVVGWASNVLTLPQALWVQAGLLVAVLTLLLFERMRIPAKYETPKP